MIELRRLAVFDLSVVFARLMGGNKIRHYVIPGTSLIMTKFTGQTPEDLVKEHIKIIEKCDEEVTFLPERTGTPFFQNAYDSDSKTLQVKEVSTIILKNHKDIEFSLAQRAIKSVLHQYNHDATPFRSRFVSPITTFLNRGICKINEILRAHQLKDKDVASMDRFEYLNLKIFQIPLLPMYGYVRKVTPCHYLTVAFEEGDIQEATESLVSDLKILNDKDLIMGHLCMPSMMLLADTTGSGKVICVLFCFLFVDHDKLMKLCGFSNPLEFYNKSSSRPLKLIGVKNETFEGGINFLNGVEPKSRYDIEEVEVAIGTPEGGRQAHINNYLETVSAVNDVAKKAKEVLTDVQVLNKTSQVGFNGLQVDADLVDKDGNKTTLDDLYRKNQDR